jgi:hypothetical protein
MLYFKLWLRTKALPLRLTSGVRSSYAIRRTTFGGSFAFTGNGCGRAASAATCYVPALLSHRLADKHGDAYV